MTVSINKYGWPLVKDCALDECADFWEDAYITDASGSGVVYTCFTDAPKRVIWRSTTASGVTTLEFSYGAWADRATLTYAPINGSLEVTP